MYTIENTALIVVDIQEKLFRVIHENEALASNTVKCIKGITALGIPVILTEQNPKGLGPTLPEISELLPGIEPVVKFDFSCFREEGFRRELAKTGRKQLLIELAGAGYEVEVVADCVSSRTPENRKTALNKLAAAGVKPTTTEMILFELLGTARHEKFRDISAIIK